MVRAMLLGKGTVVCIYVYSLFVSVGIREGREKRASPPKVFANNMVAIMCYCLCALKVSFNS